MPTNRRPPTDAEAKALASAVRLRVIRLCIDRARTNRELAEVLKLNPATMLHHVRTLVDTGFLVAEEARRGRRGAREVPYRSTGKSWRLDVGDASQPSPGRAMLEAYQQEIAGIDLERIVVTVQWEIAEKMIAAPGTKEYGALAVLVQSVADTEVLRRLPPSVFWPKPKVESGIVKIVPNAGKRKAVGDVPRFRNFLRDLYTQRRKNLRGALISLTGNQHAKAVVDARLAELGYAGTERAESLSIAQHLELCAAFAF